MAPRSVKAKKTADVKVAENDAPKKGRGKAKAVEETEFELAEPEIKEKVIPTSDKKAKRGKKPASETNGQEEANGAGEDIAPPAKKGRKKNIEEPLDEKSETLEESPIPEETEKNGDTELEPPESSAKGRKKQTKKENVLENPKESGKGKKNAKQGKSEIEVAEKIETSEEKPKSAGKGRGRKAQSKTDKEIEQGEEIEEVVKPEPPAIKGKKRGAKSKEKAAENEKEDIVDDLEEKSVEDVKKGRKNQGKKNVTKEDTEAEEAKDEVQNVKKRKTAKKEKGKGKRGDSKDDEVLEDESPEPKPAKGKRGQKKAAEADEDPLELEEPSSKRRRKPAEEKAIPADAKKKAPLKNKAATDYESIDFSNNSKTSNGKDWNFKISSWNVDGLRAWIGKGGLDYIKYEKPDILCLQEIKCSQDKFPEEIVNLQGYHPYWLSGDKDGYAGVGIYTTKLAMNVQYGLQNKELDSEGRIITAEYEQFYLICTYVPNAGRKLITLPKRLQWNEEFKKYVKELDKKKPVIICGDMNVAHNEIDLANPKTNRKNAGFTDEERAGMTELLGDGFVDTYRHLYPDNSGAYTFWTYMMNSRSKNVGWRLDYFIVSERLLSCVCDNVIRDQVYGSDHCPITLFLHLTSADKPKEF